MLRPYKFTLVTHALEFDEAGEIVEERSTDPTVFIGLPAIRAWLDQVEEQIKEGKVNDGQAT
jgi:hypothetical protein